VPLRVRYYDYKRSSFKRAYKKLAPEIKSKLEKVLEALKQHPPPTSLRLEKLSGYTDPDIWTVHVTANHSYKLSFEMDGDTAILRRIATHKEIDRAP
jgi:mRNA-degrading endonuclease YafQ of YafQ-DinJ toxin-antitoxin module